MSSEDLEAIGRRNKNRARSTEYELSAFIREDKGSIISFGIGKVDGLNKEILGLNKNAFSNLL